MNEENEGVDDDLPWTPDKIECEQCGEYDEPDGDGTCHICGWMPGTDPKDRVCEWCGHTQDELTGGEPTSCENCNEPLSPWIDLEMYNKIKTSDKILEILKRNYRPLSFSEIAKKTGLTLKKSTLNYQLKKLVHQELLTKIKIDGKDPVYTNATDADSLLDAETQKFVKTDDYGGKSFEEIKAHIKTTDVVENHAQIKDSLEKQVKLGMLVTSIESDKASGLPLQKIKYEIPLWGLPDDRCHYCREKFEDNELIISVIMQTPIDSLDEYPIHATCREKAGQNENKAACCDYCGLEFNARMIKTKKITLAGGANYREPLASKTIGGNFQSEIDSNEKALNERTEKLVDSAIATIFDDPFSKIFSCIDSSDITLHQPSLDSSMGGGLENMGLCHYVRKNGGKYHPYCAKQVEQHQVEKGDSSIQ